MDVISGKNVTSKVRLSYLDVKEEVENSCLRFKGFKAKTCYH